MQRRILVGSLLMVAFTLVAACDDREQPLGPTKGEPSFAAEEALRSVREGERPFFELAQEQPSFAGYLMEDGELVALTTDPSKMGDVRRAVQATLPTLRAARPSLKTGVPVRVVRFSFLELDSYRALLMDPLASLSDLAFLDLDEAQNKVVVGLRTGSGRLEVARLVESLGIPTDAVGTEVQGENAFNNLLARSRPLRGGQYILMRAGSDTLGACAIGFNAILNPGNLRVFLTNSHCTRDLYWPTNPPPNQTVAFQAFGNPNDSIGGEYYDPIGWNCYPGVWCRDSDAAAFLQQEPEDSVDFGYLARTYSRATGSSTGSTSVNPSNPRFEIVGKDAYPIMNEEVNKIGPRGGWTYGNVTKTCAVFNEGWWPNVNRVNCAYKAGYRSNGGDSGSPVFLWSGGNTVVLQGMNFGSDKSYNSTDGNGWFNAMAAIEGEVGQLTVYNAPPPPFTALIAGATPVPPYEWCQWWAVLQNGTPPFSYQWSGVLSGTGSTLSGSVSNSGWLYLTVTDANSTQANDQLWIEVDQQAQGCVI